MGEPVRWSGLFEDLEAQAEALARAERAAEVDDRTRSEIGGIGWRARAHATVGHAVRIRAAGGLVVTGTLSRVGPDWLLLQEQTGRELVLVASAVQSISGVARHAVDADGGSRVLARIGLRAALRAVVRDRSSVQLHLTGGDVLAGTLDRVGADFVELAAHGVGEPRRRQQVREVELVPMAALTAVSRSAG